MRVLTVPAAAAAPDDFVWLWKIDLQSAYRFWHNHATELWMYGKQWGGRGFLDCRTQFGDASMVQDDGITIAELP